MAIEFASLTYVKRSKGHNVCRRAAYNSCTKITDNQSNHVFDYSDRKAPVYHDVMLPKEASEIYKDISILWNVVEAHEIRKDAQVAKELLLALPCDIGVTLDDKIALARGFCQKNFVDHGIICQIDINVEQQEKNKQDANDPNNQGLLNNWYAKILMPTRTCIDESFGLKATHLDVDVRGGRVVGSDKRWGSLWGEHQNAYFEEKGIAVRVEPVGVLAQKRSSPGGKLLVESYNTKIKLKNRQDALKVPLVAEALLKKASTFDRDTVKRFAQKHIDEGARADFLDRFWAYPDLVPVSEGRYTTKAVVEEVMGLTGLIAILSHRFNHRVPAHQEGSLDLTVKQRSSVDTICFGPDFIYVSDDPEVDKKAVFDDLVDRYTAAGFFVRGLSCTAVASQFMRVNQFKFSYVGHVSSFLLNLRLEKIKIPDNSEAGQEVWILDDVSALPRSIRKPLLEKAQQSNCKLIFFGTAQTFYQDELRFTA